MQSNTNIQFLPTVTEDKKLEVSLDNGQAVIRLSTWTEGLGWNCQKTLSLEEEMLDELHRSLTAVRLRLKRDKSDSAEEVKNGKVLAFPTLK